jgi:hypothetical protein
LEYRDEVLAFLDHPLERTALHTPTPPNSSTALAVGVSS